MKILFVLHQFLPRHVTGTEQYARSVALELLGRGHDVAIFAFEPLIQFAAPGALWFTRDEHVDGIKVHRVSTHPLASPNLELADFENPLAGQLLARYVATAGFDVVHVFHARNIGTAAITVPQTHGVPVVVNLMDFWFLCPNFMLLRRSGELCQGPPDGGLGCLPCMSPALADVVDAAGIAGKLRRLGEGNAAVAGLRRSPSASAYALIARKARLFEVLARADAVVAPSRFLLQMFAAAGFAADKMTHIAYGVDPGRLASAPAAGDAPNKAASARLRIGYVGSISPHKGLHVLISAVRRLPAGDWQLDVHGSLDTHPEYTARIERLAGGAPRIVFHGPFVPSELGFVLSALDVVVVPSLWYENTPFSVLEALAAGIPVVASDLGGITEVVAEGSNGFLFPPGDRRALTARLAAILADRGVLARLRPVPPRSIGANVDDFIALYRRVAGAGAAAQ